MVQFNINRSSFVIHEFPDHISIDYALSDILKRKIVAHWQSDTLSLVHTSGISISIRTNKRQNKGMQSSLRHIERHKHKHKNIVEA